MNEGVGRDFQRTGANEPEEGGVELLLAQYVDRINKGEKLDPNEIYAEHAAVAPLLIKQLRAFQDIELEFERPPPLGTLGDYTLRRQIGRGGMGVVYEAWQGSMDRVVALKVLPVGIAADTQACTRFMREAQTAGKLNHQNIVGVHSTGVEEGTPWYSMEYVEGETLAQLSGRLKEADPEAGTVLGKKDSLAYYSNLADAFADVADGLQHAHSKGVTHRDIKPSNLILDSEGRLRILDFGLARLEGQESLTLSGDFVGTPAYMSPEQAKRKKIPVDHRTDIYSLGATLYELLTHQQPFQGKDHHDTLSQIIERDPRPPRQLIGRVPQDLETIALKCLRKDAGDRYGTAEAVGQDLRRFVRGDAIEARPASRSERVTRWLRKRRTPLVITTVVVLLLALTSWLGYTRWLFDYERKLLEYPSRISEAVQKLASAEVQIAALSRTTPHRLLPGLWLPSELKDVLRAGGRVPVEQAVGILEQLVDGLPEKRDGHYQLARAYHLLALSRESAHQTARAEKYRTRAVLALESTLRIDPEFLPATVLLAELAGEETLEDPQRETPVTWQTLWVEARQASREQDWLRCVELQRRLIESSSNDEEPYPGALNEAYIALGAAYFELEDFVRARASYAVAHALTSHSLETALLLGWVYVRSGDLDDAEELFQTLVAALDRSRHDEVILWIARIFKTRDIPRALAWSEKLSDEAAEARFQAKILAGRWPEQADAQRQLARVEPENAEVFRDLTATLLRSLPEAIDAKGGLLTELVDVSARALQLDPEEQDNRLVVRMAWEALKEDSRTISGELKRELQARLLAAATEVDLSLSNRMHGEPREFFEDFAVDANLTDATPLSWRGVHWGEGKFFPGPQGLEVEWVWGLDTCLFTQEVFTGDVTVDAVFSFNGASAARNSRKDPGFDVGIHWIPTPPSGYAAVVRQTGGLQIRSWPGGEELANGGLEFEPVDEFLHVEFLTHGEQLELRVWRAGKERPLAPQLSAVKGSYRRGAVVLGSGSIVHPSKRLIIRSVRIREEGI